MLPTVRQRGWVKSWEVGEDGGVEGGIRPHTGRWQTTKKWEADNLAKGRKGGWGKDNQVGTEECASLMTLHTAAKFAGSVITTRTKRQDH